MRPILNSWEEKLLVFIIISFSNDSDRQSSMFFFNSHGNTFKEVKCGPFPNVHVGNLGKFGASRRVKLFLKIELRQLSIEHFLVKTQRPKLIKKSNVECELRLFLIEFAHIRQIVEKESVIWRVLFSHWVFRFE